MIHIWPNEIFYVDAKGCGAGGGEGDGHTQASS